MTASQYQRDTFNSASDRYYSIKAKVDVLNDIRKQLIEVMRMHNGLLKEHGINLFFDCDAPTPSLQIATIDDRIRDLSKELRIASLEYKSAKYEFENA